jgi:hypothetical protein
MTKKQLGCQITDCQKNHHAKGYCVKHYADYRLSNAPACSKDDCAKPARSRGMCEAHYSAFLEATSDKYGIDYDDYWEFVKKQLKIGDHHVA